MLKLKDIFNIDISSKGGGKLYKKIMRKYNIPLKEIKEVKQEIVECSSGGGEGVKEYYYKVLDNIFDDVLIGGLLSTYTIDSVIVPIEVYGDYTIIGDVNMSLFNMVSNIAYAKGAPKAIKLLDNFNGYWDYLDWASNSYPNKFVKVGKGNIITKVLTTVPENIPEEQINQMIELVNSCLQEITKEEYESMITYKP